jgi:peptidoglycan/LPS O-acetylase OafA/YrhL
MSEQVGSTTTVALTAAKRVFFPNLDGLRFLAFFSVFLYHSFYTAEAGVTGSALYQVPYQLTRSGYLGVNFFFALSGFLITYLLLAEKELNGRIAIGAFYLRRVLRIWPLYFVVVFIGFVVMPMLKAHFGQHSTVETAQPGYFMLFLANFNDIYHGCQTPTLTLLWSVSVEEQFYLIWPLLIAVVPARYLGWLFAAIGLMSLGFRAIYVHDYKMLNMHTISVIGDMNMGGLVAWLCYRNDRLTARVAAWPRWVIGLGYALGLALIATRSHYFQFEGYVVLDRLLLSLFFVFVLLEQNYARNSLFKMANFRFLSYWGTYTYGLYCLHYIALLVAIQLLHRLGLNTTAAGVVFGDNLLALVLALGMSWVSFNFYEKPFLKLKHRFEFITR